MKSNQKQKSRIIIISIFVSLLLHLILLIIFFSPFLSKIDFLTKLIPTLAKELPLEEEKYDRITYNLIETPDMEESQINDPNRELASDKNIDAADDNPDTTPNSDDPFQEGVSDIKNFTLLPPEQTQEQEKQKSSEQEAENMSSTGYKPGNPDPAKQEDPVLNKLVSERELRANYENLNSSVAKNGNMSLNTYEWNYAPYMLKMQKKISGNMNPPPAFYAMNMIGGSNMYRFVVEPNGELSDVIFIGSETHVSLDQTSLAAINLSFPFLPLPENFPEDRLIVTARFDYQLWDRSQKN